MNLEELKANHPEVYAQAVAAGVTQERGRVSAHLTLAEGSGDTATAIDAIKAGDAVTDEVTAKHHKAAMLRATQEARAGDDATAAAAAAAAAAPAPETDDEQVASLVEARLGIQSAQE